MCLSAVLGVGSALIGASSAKKAAGAQTQAVQDAAQVQQNIFDTTSQYFEPYRQAGENALRAYEYELGLGPRPGAVGSAPAYSIEEVPGTATGGDVNSAVPYWWNNPGALPGQYAPGAAPQVSPATYRVNGQDFATRDAAQAWIDAQPVAGGSEYRGFTGTPGYDFRLREGTRALEGSAAAGGGLYSGATLQALQNYGQDYATNAYENWLGRIGGVANLGQASAGQQALQGANFANAQSDLLTQAGNARAAGSIGFGNALMGGLNTGLGVWQYQNNLKNV